MRGRIPSLGACALLLYGCETLEPPNPRIDLQLNAAARREVTDANPRVWSCNVTLKVTAGPGDRDAFVELLTLRRTIVIEGQESSSTVPATPRFPSRRLTPRQEASATDSFSSTFPFTAQFRYTLLYRDLSMRVDSTRTTTTCG